MGIKPLGSICLWWAAANPLCPCSKCTFVLLDALCRLSILPLLTPPSHPRLAPWLATAVPAVLLLLPLWKHLDLLAAQ
jgi:hypothetical protein